MSHDQLMLLYGASMMLVVIGIIGGKLPHLIVGLVGVVVTFAWLG